MGTPLFILVGTGRGLAPRTSAIRVAGRRGLGDRLLVWRRRDSLEPAPRPYSLAAGRAAAPFVVPAGGIAVVAGNTIEAIINVPGG